MKPRFIVSRVAVSSLAILVGNSSMPLAFAAENSTLKTEISSSLNGTVLVSKVTFGGRAIATGYQTDWPVITIANTETGNVTYRVESGLVRFDVGQREMRRYFAPGTRFHVSGIDLKDDRLELKLDSMSGDSAKLRLVLSQGWQSNSNINAVMAQLARVFDLPTTAPVSLSSAASSTERRPQQPTQLPSYVRSPTAPNIPERIAADDFRAILAGLDTEYRDALSPALQDGQTITRALLAFKKVYGSKNERTQGVTALQDRLGKNLQPNSASDITALSQVYLQCVRAAQFGQTRDEYGHLLGAGGNNSDFKSLLLDEAAASRLYENTQQAIQSGVAAQAAIATFKGQMLNIESALDANNLQSAFDDFRFLLSTPNPTDSVRRYLEFTAGLRNDLSDYVALKDVSRPSSMSLAQELDSIVQEHSRLNSLKSEPLTSELLNNTLAADRADLEARIAALPIITVDSSSYELPQQYRTTTPSNAAAKEVLLQQKLNDINAKLSSVAVIQQFLGRPSHLSALDEECGTSTRTSLEAKGRAVAEADTIRGNLSAALTTVQSQIQEYQRIAEAAAEAERRKEALASAQREASAIQFRGLRAEMSKNEVRSLLAHPGDALNCDPGKHGSVECRIQMGDISGIVNFSDEDKLTSYKVEISSTASDRTAPRKAFNELVARLGPGEHSNIFGDSPSFLVRTAGSQYTWGTKTTVPCLLDPNSPCASVEMLVGYADESSHISISLWDWAYQARKEGLKTPDPNAPHPTFQGELSLFGVHGGEPKPTALDVLGKNNDSGCRLDQHSYETECTLSKGSMHWSLTFYENKLASYRITFPASEWSQQAASIKAVLQVEPTDTDSRTSSVTISWNSTATLPCAVDAAKRCPMETFILSKTNAETTATGVYMYLPVVNKVIADETARDMSKYR